MPQSAFQHFDNPDDIYLEALECCEYGSKVTPKIAQDLFPFGIVNIATS